MIGPSFVEILVILVIALLVLGPKRLPGIAKSIGRGLREVRKVQQEVRGVWTDVEDGVTGRKRDGEDGEGGQGRRPKGDPTGDPTGDPHGDPVGDPTGDPDIEEQARDAIQEPGPVEQVPIEGSDEIEGASIPASGEGREEPRAVSAGGGRKLGDS